VGVAYWSAKGVSLIRKEGGRSQTRPVPEGTLMDSSVT